MQRLPDIMLHARRPAAWLVPVGAVLLIWTALFLHNDAQRSQALHTAQLATANLARAYEESLVRSIREIDQTLLHVRALHAQGTLARNFRTLLVDDDTAYRLISQVALADRHGLMSFSNLAPATTRVDLSDRAHFRHFADAPDDHLYISAPVLGRVSKLWTIQFVRMLKTPEGGFDGIVVLSVSPGDLTRFSQTIEIGPGGRIAITGLDGIIRAQMDGAARAGPTVIGARTAGPIIALAMDAASGATRWTDPTDLIARIISYRRIANQPLVLEVSMAERDILVELDADASRTILAALAMTGVVIALTLRAAGQRKRAERAQRLMQTAFEHVGVGVMVVNPGGRIAMFNARTANLLSLPAGDPDLQADPALLRAPLSRQDMAGRIIETRIEALDDGTQVCSFTDMTEATAQQRVLTDARDAAEAAVRARAQFLAAMSHEIRTPLNGILGAADLMRARPLPDNQREYADIIHQAGSHLLEMLTEILDYSKIDERGVELDEIPFAPGEILREVTEVLASRATAQGVTLTAAPTVNLPGSVVGDPHRLRQILFNLIGNAIKFTPEFGAVEASLAIRAHASGGWWLDGAVRDTGIGISEAAQPGLFAEFTQSDGSITRRFGGTGLGLAICRRLVEAMDGSIAVKSTLGVGSVFSFAIRVAEDTRSAAQRVRLLPSSGPGLIAARAPMVLIAEDTQVNRLVATHMLERLGCQVRAVVNGQDAVAAIGDGGIDLVMMDIMMPVMDGLAATRAIRALPGPQASIPIIGISANAFRSDEDAGRAAGMTGFATKPINSERLAEEIVAALGLGTIPVPLPEPKNAALDEMRTNLGDDIVAAVIAAFCTDTQVTLTELRQHAARGNLAGVAQSAHAIKGNAATLGLASLTDIARTIEQGARQTAGPTQDQLTALERAFADAVKELQPEPAM